MLNSVENNVEAASQRRIATLRPCNGRTRVFQAVASIANEATADQPPALRTRLALRRQIAGVLSLTAPETKRKRDVADSHKAHQGPTGKKAKLIDHDHGDSAKSRSARNQPERKVRSPVPATARRTRAAVVVDGPTTVSSAKPPAKRKIDTTGPATATAETARTAKKAKVDKEGQENGSSLSSKKSTRKRRPPAPTTAGSEKKRRMTKTDSAVTLVAEESFDSNNIPTQEHQNQENHHEEDLEQQHQQKVNHDKVLQKQQEQKEQQQKHQQPQNTQQQEQEDQQQEQNTQQEQGQQEQQHLCCPTEAQEWGCCCQCRLSAFEPAAIMNTVDPEKLDKTLLKAVFGATTEMRGFTADAHTVHELVTETLDFVTLTAYGDGYREDVLFFAASIVTRAVFRTEFGMRLHHRKLLRKLACCAMKVGVKRAGDEPGPELLAACNEYTDAEIEAGVLALFFSGALSQGHNTFVTLLRACIFIQTERGVSAETLAKAYKEA
ncbi:hypothetical protein HK405_014389, partial [Cladochytrium tenue]